MTKDALRTLWQQIVAKLSSKANIDEVVYVDELNAETGTPNPINADTLGGNAANKFLLKTDIDSFSDFATNEEIAATYATKSEIPDTSNLASKSDVTTSAAKEISIDSSAWSDLTATVSASGVTATNTIIVTYHPDSFTAASNAGIYCSAQGAGTLTFKCVTAPTTTIKINILIFEGVK